MRSLHFPTAKRHLLPVVLIVIISLVGYLLDGQLRGIFEYNRDLIVHQQYWRLVSAHLMHTNFNHLLLNTGGLILLWALHGEKYSPLNIFLMFVFIGLSISIGIHVFTPELDKYVGLSGLLHGIFIWGACDDIKIGLKSGYAMIIGALIKIGHEQYHGPDAALGETINAIVAIDAHLYGVIAGFIAFMLKQAWYYKLRSNNK